MIDKTKIFPLLLIILDLGAAVMFVPRKDWGNPKNLCRKKH